MKRLLSLVWLGALAPIGYAADFNASIPMQDRGASTYYINGQIEGFGPADLMVDTGSGYCTINEETLAVLSEQGRAHYVRDLTGTLADGRQMNVPVYSLDEVKLGGSCSLRNVEAAVFPGKTRLILGLSALTKAAPFIFSVDPPRLVLTCSEEQPAPSQVTAVRDETVNQARRALIQTEHASFSTPR